MTDQKAPLILVVDDYQDAREMYAEYLQFSGFRVAEARNGNEALEQAFSLKPDLILMDLRMPVMDGYEATQALRQTQWGKDLPIIAVTAAASEEQREKAFRVGCSDFVPKPIIDYSLVGKKIQAMLGASCLSSVPVSSR